MVVLIVTVMLSGCGGLATRDSSEQLGQQVSGAVAGGVVGDWLYHNVGRKGGTNPWPARIIGGAVGYGAVSTAQAKARCQQYGECGGSGQGQGASSYARVSRCGGLPEGRLWDPSPGKPDCSVVKPRDLTNNPCYASTGLISTNNCAVEGKQRSERIVANYYSQHPEEAAVDGYQFPSQQQGYQPQSLQNSRSGRGGNVFDLTVDSYLTSEVVHPRCQTGNYGHDAICLDQEAQTLDRKQTDCVEGHGPCRQNYGAFAGAYRDLASALQAEQYQLERGGHY